MADRITLQKFGFLVILFGAVTACSGGAEGEQAIPEPESASVETEAASTSPEDAELRFDLLLDAGSTEEICEAARDVAAAHDGVDDVEQQERWDQIAEIRCS